MARRKATTTTAECLAQIEQEIDTKEQELKELKAQRKQLLQQKKQEDLEELYTIPYEISNMFIDGFRLGARMMIEVFEDKQTGEV